MIRHFLLKIQNEQNSNCVYIEPLDKKYEQKGALHCTKQVIHAEVFSM